MKRILITGANSYIGDSFKKWLAQWPDMYRVDIIDMIDGTWKLKNFSGYDSVFHVAGVVHIKETKKNAGLYYRINRDMVVETARKAKAEGVKQFILMSTMSVYGLDTGIITHEKLPVPRSNYGKSKLEAESLLQELSDDSFRIAVLRPPIIYGNGCKGNYQMLSKWVKRLMIFPDIENQRSMIYVDNLSELVRFIVEDDADGLFFPQNRDYVCTSELVQLIAKTAGRKLLFTGIFNPLLRKLRKGQFSLRFFRKVFGDLIYDKSMSVYGRNYIVCELSVSIEQTENRKRKPI